MRNILIKQRFLDLSVSFKDKTCNKMNKFTYRNFDATKWIFCSKYPYRLGEIFIKSCMHQKILACS